MSNVFVFDEIGVSYTVKTDFEKVKINRQMKDYEQVLLWCKTFLLGNSFAPYKGNDIAFALLYDMNLLFESYVGHYLKKNLDYQEVSLQDRTHHLAYLSSESGKFQLKPDIVINKGAIIADTKWKLLREDKSNQGVGQADMYQLYAYGKKYSSEFLYLIYPKQESHEQLKENEYDFNRINEKKLNLKILFFDLKNPSKFMLEINKKRSESNYE